MLKWLLGLESALRSLLLLMPTVPRRAIGATTLTTPMPAPLTAITGRRGLTAASSLASDRGTAGAGVADTDMAAAGTDTAVADTDMAVADMRLAERTAGHAATQVAPVAESAAAVLAADSAVVAAMRVVAAATAVAVADTGNL